MKLVLENQFGEVAINEIIPGEDNESAQAITGQTLDGLDAGTNTPISDTDTILTALAKLQAQIDAL